MEIIITRILLLAVVQISYMWQEKTGDLLRELQWYKYVCLVGNELTGNTNLITHYNLEHAYNKFCGKKVKEKLSNFLPELPGGLHRLDKKSTCSWDNGSCMIESKWFFSLICAFCVLILHWVLIGSWQLFWRANKQHFEVLGKTSSWDWNILACDHHQGIKFMFSLHK